MTEVRIAYFGPSGTFTEMALAKLEADGELGGAVERVSASSPPATLDMVRSGEVDGAVVPIENSVQGSVPPTLDALATGDRLQIIAETELDVSFTIVVRPGTVISDVRTVRAYPHAAAQVQQWMARELPQAQVEFAASNAAAAEDVAGGLADAAVSTALAGRRFGLEVLADGVADVENARTRFVYVTKPCVPPPPTGADRTAVVLTPLDRPGTLVSALAEFSTRDIDLTFIESRPLRTSLGTYRFYIDCVGHIDDVAVADALRVLHSKADARFLGSWPSAHVAAAASRQTEDLHGHDWIDALRRGDR
ncbi:MAG: prephenate dehydratase [Rhodococcus sp. (in: high G+C Gram-positive bacteria)]